MIRSCPKAAKADVHLSQKLAVRRLFQRDRSANFHAIHKYSVSYRKNNASVTHEYAMLPILQTTRNEKLAQFAQLMDTANAKPAWYRPNLFQSTQIPS